MCSSLVVTQSLRHVGRGNAEMHRLVSLIVLRHNILTFELLYCGLNMNLSHVFWTKYELMVYGAAYCSHSKIVPEDISSEINSNPGLTRITTLSETNLLSLCLGNIQC